MKGAGSGAIGGKQLAGKMAASNGKLTDNDMGWGYSGRWIGATAGVGFVSRWGRSAGVGFVCRCGRSVGVGFVPRWGAHPSGAAV